MRIVLYSHSARLGGAELAAPALAQQLGAELWTRASAHATAAFERGLRLRVLPATWDRRPQGPREVMGVVDSIVRAQVSLARSLARTRPEVVVTNNVQGALHLTVGCALTRTPLVVYLRDLGRGGNRSPREVAVYRFLVSRFAAGCIANSQLTLESWDLGGIPSVVVPTAVPEVFYDRPRRARDGRIVMLGRLATWKGQAQVVRAMDRVHRTRPVTLRIVGGALFDDDVVLPTHEVPVELTGHTDSPWLELEEAALLVHASITPEPFGQVLAQAAAAGVPMICADRGGQLEWLEEGVLCLTADPRNEEALASAILAALSDPALAQRRARKARERAEGFREARAYAPLKPWLADLVARTSSRKSRRTRSRFSDT